MNRANWQREEPEVQRKAAAFNRWHEPDDARVSSPDLLEARSEIPWAYSAIATEMGYPRDVRFPPYSDHIADAQTCRKGATNGLMHRNKRRARVAQNLFTPLDRRSGCPRRW